MEEKPYFCPNCRSNRIKFQVMTSYSERILKNAMSGEITERDEPMPVPDDEAVIQCGVCDFVGNEMRFIKQAEREPRPQTEVHPSYV